jgi:GT2 family glycosyltransferase
MTRVAVVILNYNGRNFLKQFLPSVIAHSDGARIVVADNGSSDDSVSLVQSEFPTVELIRFSDNLGFCEGYNAALKQIQSDYYVLLNSDIEVTPNWLRPVITLLDQNTDIAAAQPKIRSWYDRERFEYAGAAGGFIDRLGYPFCRGRIFDTLENDNGQYDDTRPVFWATGACLFIKAELYHKMRGLDKDFFAHMEEIDLCWKLNRSGYRVYYCAESTVYHVGGGTLPATNPKKTYLNFHNGMCLLLHHVPLAQLLWKLPARILLDLLAAVNYLTRNKPADAWAIVRAQFQVLKRLRYYWTKRKEIKKVVGPFDVQFLYPSSIVFDYFVLRRHTFRELNRF